MNRFVVDKTLLFQQNDRMFLKTVDDNQVPVVTSNIVPTNPLKFLVDYVLSYGHFETEIDLFDQQSMLDVFKHSDLLENKNSYKKTLLL